MKATFYTVNKTGIEEIRQFLAKHHKKGGEHFTPDMLRAWAAEAEFQLGEGNPAAIEIRGRDSVTGVPVTRTITDGGLDAEVVEIDE